MTLMTQPWSQLSERFSTIHAKNRDFDLALKAIGDLCEWLAQHAIEWQLSGHSSHHHLIITQVEPHYPLMNSIQRLVVKAMSDGQVKFAFQQHGLSKASYQRSVLPDETVLQMCKFLTQTGWVKSVPFPEEACRLK